MILHPKKIMWPPSTTGKEKVQDSKIDRKQAQRTVSRSNLVRLFGSNIQNAHWSVQLFDFHGATNEPINGQIRQSDPPSVSLVPIAAASKD